MSSTMNSNFRRHQSKVWWGNNSPSTEQRTTQKTTAVSKSLEQNASPNTTPPEYFQQRRDSPGSLRSQDSGFSDHSPNSSTHDTSPYANNEKSSKVDENRNYLTESPSKLSPKPNVNFQINACIRGDESPSICSDKSTPPTVIRKKFVSLIGSPAVRKISFSEPSSPVAPGADSDKFLSMDPFLRETLKASIKKTNSVDRRLNRSRLNRRSLLECVAQVSGSVGDVYMLAESSDKHNLATNHIYESLNSVRENPQRAEQQTPKASLKSLHLPSSPMSPFLSYNNETVVFGSGNDESITENLPDDSPSPLRERLPLPTYDELYPPNGSSTPKMLHPSRSAPLPSSSSEAIITPFTPRTNATAKKSLRSRLIFNESIESILDLSATLNWQTCTYIEYTNPLLNGHDPSVQFWVDETRTTFAHEILSTLQTKSILIEATRTQRLSAPIASKLIQQIRTKATTVECDFNELEKVFVTHASRSPTLDGNETFVIGDDSEFKTEIQELMQQLTINVCQFMSQLNSRVIFQSMPDQPVQPKIELKKFEANVRDIVESCQDLRVACDTKLDDIEAHNMLEDLYSLRQSVLKAIRRIYRRLVNVIVSGIEEQQHDLLMRANINMIASLSAEGVGKNSGEFGSLTEAFMGTEVIRVLLVTCLDSKQSSIRAMSLRALATVCSTPDTIRQFIENDGIEVVTEILNDTQKLSKKLDSELREAVSVLAQITAPWHSENRNTLEDALRGYADSIVSGVTNILDSTECPQTIMLCAACLNNLSRESPLTFYSLMSNRTVVQLKNACHRQLQRQPSFSDAVIFVYEQATSMMFNMAGNKKCHQHLASKEIMNFIATIFHTQFHLEFAYFPEAMALKKTTKNILHIFARLLHHTAVGHDSFQHNILPIFALVERMASNVYAKDLAYIHRKLDESNFGSFNRFNNNSSPRNNNSSRNHSLEMSPDDFMKNPRKLSLSNAAVLESYV